jgi:FMN-dependent NADH-azoreductase
MKDLLHLIVSPRAGRSHSRQLSNHFVSQWTTRFPDCRIVTRDLRETILPHVTEPWIAANFTAREERSPAMHDEMRLANQLADELIAADALVISTPIYNFGLPSALAAWLAHIILPGRTVTTGRDDAGEDVYMPLLNAPKPIWVCVTAGALGQEPGGPLFSKNGVEPQLRNAFNFIGLHDLQFFYVAGRRALDAQKSRARDAIDTSIAAFFDQ